MAFPDGFVEEVRRAADIVRVISEHVPLKKMGTSWKGLCPFHQEKSPSFNVRSEPAVFHCFGCGEGGDVFKFVMLRERVNFPEAIEIVARRFGIVVPETRGFERGEDRKEREEILALLDAAAQHFTRNFWTAPGTKAREYLLGRGFKKETLEKIRTGAAPDSWNDLLDALRKKFAPHLLLTAGLILERQAKEGHNDRFRSRGTALTAAHGRLLHRFSDRVILNFDQDDAGKKATLKSLEILTEEGMDVRIVSLPEGHDPDTYLREAGGDAYRERLKAAPGYVEW